MASEPVVLADNFGDKIEVTTGADLGEVFITFHEDDDHITMGLSGERLDAFREAVDRCAMPGQPPATDSAPTREEIDRCGYSEDPYHRCRVCYDYAAEDYRPVRLTEARRE